MNSTWRARVGELFWPSRSPTDSIAKLHDLRYWRLLWAFALLILITAIATPYLPMADLPQHAAQVGMLRHFSHYSAEYEINWFTPYLLGYGITYGLSFILGVTLAIRVVVGLALGAFVLTSAALVKEAGGRPSWALLAVPTVFGFCFDWGFLNYLVGAPVLLATLTMLLRWSKLQGLTGLQVLALVALGHVLLLSHVLIYALSGLLAILIFLSNGPSLLRRILRVAYLGAATPTALWWLTRTQDIDPQVREAVRFGLSWSRLGFLGSDMVGLEAGTVYATLGWLAITLPWFQGARFAKPFYRWAPLVLVLGIFLLGPTRAFGTHFVANRFSLFVVPFYLFALNASPDGTRNERAAPPALMAMFATLAFSFWARDAHRFTLESRSYGAVSSRIEARKKALYLPFTTITPFSSGPAYLHFGSYYTAEKQGDVDFNFAQFFPQMVRIKHAGSRPIGAAFSFAPGKFDWQTHRGDNYDYFIVRAHVDVAPIILKNAPGRTLEKLVQHGPWWLFQKRVGSSAQAQHAREVPQTP